MMTTLQGATICGKCGRTHTGVCPDPHEVSASEWWKLTIHLRGGQSAAIWVDNLRAVTEMERTLLDRSKGSPVSIQGVVATPLIVIRTICVHPETIAAVEIQQDNVVTCLKLSDSL
jgi:hypothetical protein